MLDKISEIISIAKFKKFTAKGDIQLKKVNLIYGDNGKGKSTLVTILRSLSTGDPKFIKAKDNKSVPDSQAVDIRLPDKSHAIFNNDKWNKTVDNIIIFDAHYVSENIFAGDHVSAKNKQNLFTLVVGKDSVAKAEKIQKKDEAIREIRTNINRQEEVIAQHNKENTPLGDYLEINKDPKIDEKIGNINKEINSIQDQQAIKNENELTLFELPNLDFNSLKILLAKSIESIEKNAIEKFKSKTAGIDENWIKTGLEFSIEDECPFCKQSLSELEIIEIYQHFFNEELLKFKIEVEKYFPKFDNQYDEDLSHLIQKSLGDNKSSLAFWKKHIPNIDLEDIRDLVKSPRDQIMVLVDEHLKIKANDILSPKSFSKELNIVIKEYTALSKVVSGYNQQVEMINKKIGTLKSSIGKYSLTDARNKKTQLENIKGRHSSNIINLISKLGKLNSDLKSEQTEKKNLQKQLKTDTEDILNQYKDRLNSLLQNKFGLDFEIDKPKTNFQGRPNTTYVLKIDGEEIPLGSQNTDDKPAFRTTLSEGEKSSLAFAFFISQIEQLPNLNEKIVVLDDPITSLDGERRECIRDEIVALASKVKQIIVLSHDPFFLKLIEEKSTNPKTLSIIREGDSSVIREWNLKNAVRSQYFKDFEKIRLFIKEGEGAVSMSDVARAIRPVLEANLRIRYPDNFPPHIWLGEFLGIIRDADDASNLAAIKDKIDELDAINDFSKKFHHDTDPGAETNLSTLTEAKLTNFARRTITFLQNL